MTYLSTMQMRHGFFVIRLDTKTEGDLNTPVETVGSPHRSRQAANKAARLVCAETGEFLTNAKGKRI